MLAFYTTLAQVSAAAPPDLPSTANVVFVGFLFVMIVLALLATITSAIGAVFIRQAAREAAKAAVAAQKAAESARSVPAPLAGTFSPAVDPGSGTSGESAGADDSTILAVVAAAVHTVIGDRPHRVVSVRSTGPGWAQEGRRQIFSSHRVR
ncbi:MAG TPA: hypothetical protein DCY38_00355 [Opitutae bacterium]|mgnify:CR=1 FL=1|nr:hypothetical protein [Opitutae bacterium]